MTKRKKPSPIRQMHDQNRISVLVEVLRGDSVTRQEIQQRTGLTHATVSRITRSFINSGLIYEGDTVNGSSSLGRRRIELKVNSDAGFVIGVCLSAFIKYVSIVDVVGRRKWEEDIPADVAVSPSRTIDFIVDTISRHVNCGHFSLDRLLGIGVVVAGSVDSHTGEIINAPLLHWANVQIREILGDRLKLPVAVENMADGLCLASLDRLYSDRGANLHMFLVHVAVGMGASLMIDREIVRRRGDEAWIARVPTNVIEPITGEARRLGDLVSGKAILSAVNHLASIAGTNGFEGEVTEMLNAAVCAANTGDHIVSKTFFEAGQLLGRTLGLLTTPFLPDILLLAGPVALAAPFQKGVEEGFRCLSEMVDDSSVDVVINQMNYLDASENLGLRQFLLPGLLALSRESE